VSHEVGRNRSWISVYFKCCRVYQRVYRDRDGMAYTGWCPKCGRKAVVKISPLGTDSRFFEAH